MAAREASLRITDAYRGRMLRLRGLAESSARAAWGRVDLADLDGSYERFLGPTVVSITHAQREGVRLSAAYLAAFVSSELGRRVSVPRLDASGYVGVARNGTPLSEALRSPLIGVKATLLGTNPEEAMKVGLNRAIRAVGLASDSAARQSLTDLMAQDPHVAGWRRAVRGTCDACLGAASETLAPPGTPLEIHPGCACVAEPAIKSVPDHFPRPSGTQIFAAMSAEHQDSTFGPEKAALLRAGEISLGDCVAHSHLATEPDFITAKSLEQIQGTPDTLRH